MVFKVLVYNHFHSHYQLILSVSKPLINSLYDFSLVGSIYYELNTDMIQSAVDSSAFTDLVGCN